MYVECVEIDAFRRKEGVFKKRTDSDPCKNSAALMIMLTVFGWLDNANQLSVRFGKRLYDMTEHPERSGNWEVTVKIKPETAYTWNLVEGGSGKIIKKDAVEHSIQPLNADVTKVVVKASWGEEGTTSSSYKSADREFPYWNPPKEFRETELHFLSFITHYVVQDANHLVSVETGVMNDNSERLQVIGEEIQANWWMMTLGVPQGSEVWWCLNVLDSNGVHRRDTNKHFFTVQDKWNLLKCPWARPYEVQSLDDEPAKVDSGISSESSANASLRQNDPIAKTDKDEKTEEITETHEDDVSGKVAKKSTLFERISSRIKKSKDCRAKKKQNSVDDAPAKVDSGISLESSAKSSLWQNNAITKTDEDKITEGITVTLEDDVSGKVAKKSTIFEFISSPLKKMKKHRAKKGQNPKQTSQKPRGGVLNRMKKVIVTAFRCSSATEEANI